jgi:regulation of enolase protein 1 (concanavalin A-like superfamily)
MLRGSGNGAEVLNDPLNYQMVVCVYVGPPPSMRLAIRVALVSTLLVACGPSSSVDRVTPFAGGSGGGGTGGQSGVGGGSGGVSGGGGGGTGGSDAGGTPEASSGGAGGTGGTGGGGGTGGSAGVGGSAGTGGTGGSGTGGAAGTGGTDAAVAPPAAPTGLTAVPGDGHVNLSWSAASGATSYNLQRATGSGPFAVVASSITATSQMDTDLTNGTNYRYTVSASNSGGEGPVSAIVSATPIAPVVWTSQDIGVVGVPGSGQQNGATFSVSGAGDVWDTADACHFMYQAVSGDATLTARAVTLQAVEVWSKAAIMMRDGLAPNARNVVMLSSPTNTNAYRFQARTTTGDITSTERSGATGTVPVWLRLVRRGNTFTGYSSSNGTNWSQVGTPRTIAMPSSIQMGLFATSHNTTATATATFDNVSITTP